MEEFTDIKGTTDYEAPILFEATFEEDGEQPIEFTEPSKLTIRGWSTEQLVSFGNFILSDYRTNLIKAMGDVNPDNSLFEERVKEVSHADIKNWQFLNKI